MLLVPEASQSTPQDDDYDYSGYISTFSLGILMLILSFVFFLY